MAHPCRLDLDVARARLARLGMTQTSLARACGVELRTLQRWFAGAAVSVTDAEQLARALGIGTEDLFRGFPAETGTPLGRLRDVIRLLGNRSGAIGQATRTALEHFTFIDEHISFASHPARGFVHRLPMRDDDRGRFEVFRVSLVRAPLRPVRIAWNAQVGLRFRYEFGEVRIDGGEALLTEHFHTRAVRASLDGEKTFDVFTWIPREMRELIVVCDDDVDVAHVRGVGRDVFDLRDHATRHAVCFRPAPMHLREVGLPPTFDRVVGPREGRVDVPV